jgi:hypothetical protein
VGIAVTLLLWSLALVSGLVAYSVTSVMAGALFARFTSTRVQILTQKALIRQLLLCQRMKVCVSSAGLRYAVALLTLALLLTASLRACGL